MAKPNYSFEKRQRELAKKQKQDEKLQRRLERKNNPLGDDPNAPAEAVDGTEPIEGDESEPQAGAGSAADSTPEGEP